MKAKLAAAAMISVFALGCGSDKPTADEPADSAAQTETQGEAPGAHAATTPQADPGLLADRGRPKSPNLPAPNAQPQTVVRAFLEATRAGDESMAGALLTRRAIEETRKRGLSVQPIGSPTMKYTIGRTEPAPNNGVYVKCLWTEPYSDGTSDEYEVVWVLRQEPVGWRIAGMAAQLEPEDDPIFLDFEFPDELARRLNDGSSAANIAEAPEPQDQRQAKTPQTPPTR